MAPPGLLDPVLVAIDPRGIATVTLNRPERGNAYPIFSAKSLIIRNEIS